MSGRTPGPCEVPDPGHDGEVHLYHNGLRCDEEIVIEFATERQDGAQR